MAKKQTAGRDNLGDFAPKFAELNDDVLFGEVWSREDQLSAHQRSLITISALISAGNFEQLPAHLKIPPSHQPQQSISSCYSEMVRLAPEQFPPLVSRFNAVPNPHVCSSVNLNI